LLTRFAQEREQYNYFMNNLSEIDKALSLGALKAHKVADAVLARVRTSLGY
jgi:tryptophanyl-tRNA synthetase